jgi:hypothetical protein
MLNGIMWGFYPVAKFFIFSLIVIIAIGRLLFEIGMKVSK